MKNKLKLLINDGLNKKINTKWFKIVNIVLIVIIIAIANVDNLIKSFGGDFSDEQKIHVYDKTNIYFDILKEVYNQSNVSLNGSTTEMIKATKDLEEFKNELKSEKKSDIILVINNNEQGYNVEYISYDYIDPLTLQILNASIEQVKTSIAISTSGLSEEEINKIFSPVTINKTYLNEDTEENGELTSFIGSMAVPMFILPFFFLILLVTQMIGAEINEEKTSKSMEIIITSVSPKTHFLAKIITANIYAILQSLLFIVYILIGLFVRKVVTGQGLITSLGGNVGGMLSEFTASSMMDTILKCLPFIIIMILLSFIAYSLLAGILASMTTSQEDFQQLQTPMMILIMLGYILSILASTYEKSTFIIVVSLIPFISCILSPVLLVIGQIHLGHVLISIVLLMLIIFVLIKYGLRIYKRGILNYSADNLWKKMFQSIKNE